MCFDPSTEPTCHPVVCVLQFLALLKKQKGLKRQCDSATVRQALASAGQETVEFIQHFVRIKRSTAVVGKSLEGKRVFALLREIGNKTSGRVESSQVHQLPIFKNSKIFSNLVRSEKSAKSFLVCKKLEAILPKGPWCIDWRGRKRPGFDSSSFHFLNFQFPTGIGVRRLGLT